MLLWQHRKRIFRKKLFLLELFTIALLCHAIFIGLIFFVYKGSYYTFHVNVHRNKLSTVPIFFLHTQHVNNKRPQAFISQQKKIVQAPRQKIVQSKGAPKNLVPRSQQKVNAKKTIIKKKTTTIQPSVKQGTPSNKVKFESKKKDTLNTEIKKKIEPQRNINQQHKKSTNKQQPKHTPSISSKHECQSESLRTGDQHCIETTNGGADFNALYIQEYIQKEVAHVWKPPHGLQKKLACTIKVLIDWNGNVIDVNITESSGVLVYDIAARTAASALSLPHWSYGKEFLIAFKQ